MNDFDFDNLQKKRIAANARHKKGGSKSKRCTLPSDYLTPAQIRKLSGETMTYQTKKPITWDEFKRYPCDMQKIYLQHYAETHSCTMTMMAKMFGCSAENVMNYIRRRPQLHGIMHKTATEETKAAFNAWLDEHQGGVAKIEQSATENAAQAEQTEGEESQKEQPRLTLANCIKNGRVSVEGTPEEIGIALLNIFQRERIRAQITFEVVGGA